MTTEFDKKYLNSNTQIISGIDEAGRGPLAGDVCIAIVIMPLDDDKLIDGINDSKKISAKKRELLFDKIISQAIAYDIEFIDNFTIDKINILEATKLGMKKCIDNIKVKPDLVLIDAVKINNDTKTESIIKGDSLSYNIACASILAKVSRDRKMMELDKIYPQYNFKKHKGYGTKEHIENLKRFGKCPIHRDTFIKHFI